MPKGGNPAEFLSFAHLIVSFPHDLGGKPCKKFTFSPVECVAVLMPKGGSPAEFSTFSYLIVSFPHDFRGKTLQKFSPLALMNVSLLYCPRGETLHNFRLFPI